MAQERTEFSQLMNICTSYAAISLVSFCSEGAQDK